MNEKSRDGRILLLVLTLLASSWGILGWADLRQQTQAGFDTNGNNTVTRVYSGSPAAVAGLLAGDFITHFDGVAAEDAATMARLPRKKAGEWQSITVERDGQSTEVFIAYGLLSAGKLSLARASLIVGFCFLLLPLAAYFVNPLEATRVLVVVGFGLSFAFMTGPYIADFSIRSLTVAITSLFVLFGVAALLQFLLVFPQKRPWLQRSYGKKLLYLPALLLWLLIAYRVLFTPAATGGLNTLTNFMAGIIIGGYLFASLFQVLRNYSRTHKAQRQALALNWMLLATIVGLVPATIAQLVMAFSPHASLPGQDYFFVTLALIPLSWARSASLLRDT